MFSKVGAVVISGVLFLTLGCGLKFGEKNKEINIFEVKTAACLTQSVTQLKLFFKAEATDNQVSDSFACLQEALIAFKDNVRGQDLNSYTPSEIAKYISKQFAKDGSGLSVELLTEIMKLKVILVGGSSEILTKTEIQSLSDLIGRLKPEVVRLNPHMKIITTHWLPATDIEMNEKKFSDAKSAFELFLNKIALLLATSDQAYQLNDLINLAIESVKISNTQSDVIKTLNNARQLVVKFKTLLIGGTPALVGKEWIPFAKSIGEIFFQSLRFKYFFNHLTENQISQKWKVYEQVVVDVSTLMQDLMTFKNSNLLKNSEIIELLEAAKPVLTGLNINAELVPQIGKVKVMLLGQHPDGKGFEAWSKNDFFNLNAKASVLTKNIGVIIQNFKYFKANKDAFRKNEIKYEDFNNSELLVLAAVNELAAQIEAAYDILELKNLIVNLSETLLKDSLKLPENFPALMELVKSVKYTLTGTLGTRLTQQDIQLLMKVGIRAYANYVEYINFVNVFTVDEKEFSYNLDKLFVKVKDTLSIELKLKPIHMILTEEFSDLILTAQTQKFLTTKFDQKSLSSLFKTLWENVLNKPEERLAKKVLPGLNVAALEIISEEFKYWIENQKSIIEIFTARSEYTKETLLVELSKKINTAYGKELNKVVAAPGLMNFNDKSYLKILTETNGLYHVKDLNKTNLSRTISRIVIRSFANEIERINKLSGVTLEEVQYGFDQIKEVLFCLDLVDRSNVVFISSRFRESNLFLSVSNGDSLADFEEINHLILHIFSGINRADSLKTIAMQKCLKVNSDIVSKIEFGQNCLLDLYFNEENSFADMPGFAKLKTGKDDTGELHFSPDVNKAYYLGLLKAAGYVPNDKIPDEERTVFLGDANLFPHVVQYVEMIFFRHDSSGDGYLQKNEAIKAFPIFAEVMKPVQKQFNLDDKEMVGLFVWLLKKGTVFPINNMKKFAKDYECNLNNDAKTCSQDWTINATRIDIGKIFNLIAMLTAPKPPAAEPDSKSDTKPDTKP